MVNNLIVSLINNIKNSFSLTGRISRKSFLVFFIFFQLYAYLFHFLTNLNFDTKNSLSVFIVCLFFALAIFGLILIISLFTCIIKRLHDLNTSAWWLLITFIPFGVLLFFALPFKKGTEGRNKYGEPPKY